MSRDHAFMEGSRPFVVRSLFAYNMIPSRPTMERVNLNTEPTSVLVAEMKSHLQKVENGIRRGQFERFSDRYGIDGDEKTREIGVEIGYVEKLLKDASDENAQLSLERAIALYGADLDDRKLLGAFLLLFSGLTGKKKAEFSRKDALEVLRNKNDIMKGITCTRGNPKVQKLIGPIHKAAQYIADYVSKPAAQSMQKIKNCADAVNLVKGFLIGKTSFDEKKGTRYGAGEKIKVADEGSENSSPLIFTRLGIVTRLDPSLSRTAHIATSQRSNQEILTELNKNCHEKGYKWAHSSAAAFDPDLRNELISKLNEKTPTGKDMAEKEKISICKHYEDIVKQLLETACDPPPKLSANPTLDERRIQAAMIFCMLPMPRDSPKVESELRSELSNLYRDKDRFVARIKSAVESSKFQVTDRMAFAKTLMKTEGFSLKEFQDVGFGSEHYGDFLWNFLQTIAVQDPHSETTPVRETHETAALPPHPMDEAIPEAVPISPRQVMEEHPPMGPSSARETTASVVKSIRPRTVDMLHALAVLLPLARLYLGDLMNSFLPFAMEAVKNDVLINGEKLLGFWSLTSRDLLGGPSSISAAETEILKKTEPDQWAQMHFTSCLRKGIRCPPIPAGLVSNVSKMLYLLLLLRAVLSLISATSPLGAAMVILSHHRTIDLAAVHVLGTKPPIQSAMKSIASYVKRTPSEPTDAAFSRNTRRRIESSNPRQQEVNEPIRDDDMMNRAVPSNPKMIHHVGNALAKLGSVFKSQTDASKSKFSKKRHGWFK